MIDNMSYLSALNNIRTARRGLNFNGLNAAKNAATFGATHGRRTFTVPFEIVERNNMLKLRLNAMDVILDNKSRAQIMKAIANEPLPIKDCYQEPLRKQLVKAGAISDIDSEPTILFGHMSKFLDVSPNEIVTELVVITPYFDY